MIRDSLTDSTLLRRYDAISVLFEADANLLGFLFYDGVDQFQRCAAELLRHRSCMREHEAILVATALDIWSGRGVARLPSIVSGLDDFRLARFVDALTHLRLPADCHCPICRQDSKSENAVIPIF